MLGSLVDGPGPVIRFQGRAVASLKGAWGATRRRAGVSSLRPNDMRHTYATRALERGANIKAVAAILGHEDIGQTAIYAHATEESVWRAVTVLDEKTGTGTGTENPP